MRFVSVVALLVGLAAGPVEALTVTYTGAIDCQGLKTGDCVEQRLLPALGHGPLLKLRADHATDTVHGSVSLFYCPPPCLSTITVIIYETGEPSNGAHKTTFTRPSVLPTEASIRARLATLAPR